MEKYKIPRTIEAVEVLIKTFNGKTGMKAYRKNVQAIANENDARIKI